MCIAGSFSFFRRKPTKRPMPFCKPSAYVSWQTCPLESKLSVVHIRHNTKSNFVTLAKQQWAINRKNILPHI